MTSCKTEGQLVFATADSKELDDLINRTLIKGLEPILVFGTPDAAVEGFSADNIQKTRQRKQELFPDVSIVQLIETGDFDFSMQALSSGVRSIFPVPNFSHNRESFVADTINFLTSLQRYVSSCYEAARRQHFSRLRHSLVDLQSLSKAPEVALSMLQFIGEIFDRSLTLIIDKDQLLAERSIGLLADKAQGVAAAQKFRFPISEDSIFQHVIKSGEIFYGPIKDKALEEHLFAEIGAPLESSIFIAPLMSNGRAITLTYADFGNEAAKHVPLEFIEFFASQAGIVMENILFRRRIEKAAKPQDQD
jgi:hypothetical protein